MYHSKHPRLLDEKWSKQCSKLLKRNK